MVTNLPPPSNPTVGQVQASGYRNVSEWKAATSNQNVKPIYMHENAPGLTIIDTKTGQVIKQGASGNGYTGLPSVTGGGQAQNIKPVEKVLVTQTNTGEMVTTVKTIGGETITQPVSALPKNLLDNPTQVKTEMRIKPKTSLAPVKDLNLSEISKPYGATSSFKTINAKTFVTPKDNQFSSAPDLRTYEEKLKASRQEVAREAGLGLTFASIVGAPLTGGLSIAPYLGTWFGVGAASSALSSVSEKGEFNLNTDLLPALGTGAITATTAGIFRGLTSPQVSKAINNYGLNQSGVINIAGNTKKVTEQSVLQHLGKTPQSIADAKLSPTEIKVMEAALEKRLAKEVGATSTPNQILEIVKQIKVPKIDSLFPSLGEQGAINFSGGLGSIYSTPASIVSGTAGKVLGNSLGRGLILFGTSIAIPEITVGVANVTTKKPPVNLNNEQWEQVYGQGFKEEQIGQSFTSTSYTKTSAKPGDASTLITETGTNYTPRQDVGFNVSVPFIGQFTPYTIFPTVAVDYALPFFGGKGNIGQESFKKGAKQKALELGLSDVEATQASEYAWTTQGGARSYGELIGIIPATVSGEEIGQGLVGGAVKKGFVNAGIAQVGKSFIYTSGKKAGESALLEAGKIVFRKALPGLAVAGAAEGGSFGYLMGQAQGQKGLDLGATVLFSSATGAISAPLLGAPVAKWAITRPLVSKVAMGGLYVADWSESIGDFGASSLSKAAVKTFTPKTFTPTTVFDFGSAPVNTKQITEKQVASIWNPTSVLLPTTTTTNTNITNIVETPVTTPVTTPTNVPTYTSINNYTDTVTNTEVPTYTITNTNIFTPTTTATPTFTPNIPLLPFLGIPGGSALNSGGKAISRKKYYNELSLAFAAFNESDILGLPIKRKRKKGKRK